MAEQTEYRKKIQRQREIVNKQKGQKYRNKEKRETEKAQRKEEGRV